MIQLSPDTQAILLLCANFQDGYSGNLKPLNIAEYNQIVEGLWLQGFRPSNLLESSTVDLNSLTKIDSHRLEALLKRGVSLSLSLENWYNQGIWIISRADHDYPEKLKKNLRHLAPPAIFGVGNISLLRKGGLAVVGSRKPDSESLEYTKRIAESAVNSGMQIVSGGANGIDQIGMLTALETNGTAVGVLADSLTRESVSKKYRNGLQSGNLVLITTYSPDVGFNVGNAMGRNKYIYALSDYGLVICADFNQGGTWSGAKEVLEKYPQIPLFVRKEGNIPEGNQKLLEKGALAFPESPWGNRLKSYLEESPLNGSLQNGYVEAKSSSSQFEFKINNQKISELLLTPLESRIEVKVIGFYDHFLQVIPSLLPKPCKLRDILEAINSRSKDDMTEQLLKKYLERAVNEGFLKRDKKGIYSLLNIEDQAQRTDKSLHQLALLS